MNDSQIRTPPFSVTAEQSVLGALLLHQAAFDQIAHILSETDFYRYDHRLIFRQIVSLTNACKPVDVITVFDVLSNAGKAEETGCLVYLNALAQNTPSSANIRHYADIVRENSIRRQAINIMEEAVSDLFTAQDLASEIVDRASTQLDEVCAEHGNSDPVSIQEVLTREIERMDEAYNAQELDGKGIGILCGIEAIDRRTNDGFKRGDLIIIAGRPSMGKSLVADTIGCSAAINYDHSVLLFGLEMSESATAQRVLARTGSIHLEHLAAPKKMVEEDWPKLTNSVQKLHGKRIFLDCQPGLGLFDIRNKAKSIKRRYGLDLIAIDYLQLMKLPKGEHRHDLKLGEITMGLKNLAKELDVAILLLSQLNRNCESRPNKRPLMADLRESGSIEQDADIIMMLYRDEVYNSDSPDKGTMEIDFAKIRQGERGVERVLYDGAHSRIANLARDWQRPEVHEEKSHSHGRGRYRAFDDD